jgi:glycerol-3-phosphate cytidylyltransferase-like family protein
MLFKLNLPESLENRETSNVERFQSPYHKIVGQEQAIELVARWKNEGQKVVMVDSVVDIPHYRHADYFRACANLGNKLIVRVESDELVASRKDPRGPIVPFEARVKHVVHYPYIDIVTEQVVHGLDFLQQFKPNILVKSVTSGSMILDQIEILKSKNEYFGIEVIVMDQFAKIIDPARSYVEGLAYDQNKFGSDKLSGSTIKQEIVRRTLEDHQIKG